MLLRLKGSFWIKSFVANELGSRVDILFTLAVPVQRVLANRELLPRISDFASYLREGLGKCRSRDENTLLERWHKTRLRALVIGGSGLLIPRRDEIGPRLLQKALESLPNAPVRVGVFGMSEHT